MPTREGSSNRRHRSSGQTIVEFALILPLFLALVFAVIDAGRAVALWTVMSNAARDGARYAATHGIDPSTSQCTPSSLDTAAMTQVALHSAGPLAGSMTVAVVDPASGATSCSTDSSTGNAYYTVRVTASFQPITTLVFGGGPISLSAQSRMFTYTF